ncbi:MAG: Zn-ribbon domain-containing OB-fold protein [Anaerolineae bacterium]|nr:Zn-ribbon domain-containing OB-fold protein [Anaerolineae bacterium]
MADNGSFTAKEYYDYLADHKIMGTRCVDNGNLFVPPRAMCPDSHSTNMEWAEVKGSGTLRAFTVIGVGPTAMVEAGYNIKNPYCAGIVELEEGPSVAGQILGVDVSKPETIKIGMPLKAAFVERGEGDAKRTYLAFEPA